MTTSQSPLSALKAQADSIAKRLKSAQRGDYVPDDFAERIEAAKSGTFKVGIVMDDKVITLEMEWATIQNTSEVSLAAYVLKLMRDAREH